MSQWSPVFASLRWAWTERIAWQGKPGVQTTNCYSSCNSPAAWENGLMWLFIRGLQKMQNLLWNMLPKWLHVTLLLHPLLDSSLGFVTLSLTFGLQEDTWSTCGVKAKRNLLERANAPVATTKADGLGFSQILRFTDVDKLCPLRPRSKDPPQGSTPAGRQQMNFNTHSVRRCWQMICVCSWDHWLGSKVCGDWRHTKGRGRLFP